MGCEIRNGQRYYYRSERQGNRVIRRYLGAGDSGLFRDTLCDLERLHTLERKARARDVLVAADQVEQQARDWYQAVETMFRGAMTSAGYYRHQGGEWRRHRQRQPGPGHQLQGNPEGATGDMTDMLDNTNPAETALVPAPEDDPDDALFSSLLEWSALPQAERKERLQALTFEQRRAVVAAAQTGRKDLLPVALDVVRPAATGMYDSAYGGTASMVSLLVASAGGVGGDPDPIARQVVEAKAKQLYHQVAGPYPTPLESMLADRIVACALLVDHYQKCLEQATVTGNMKAALNWEKRFDAANRRYLASIKSLALVRRLQIPMLQVNIGEKQINIVQDGAGTNEGSSTLPRNPIHL